LIIHRIAELRRRSFGVLIELAGGLFTPLTLRTRNADLLVKLDPTAIVAVAPDRLGVLHDVGALVAGAAYVGIRISGLVLSAPARGDRSTGTNANEIELLTTVPLLLTLERRRAPLAAPTPEVDDVLAALLRGRALKR